MAADYGVPGWDRFDGFVAAFRVLGRDHQELPEPNATTPWPHAVDASGYGHHRPLRQLHYTGPDGRPMVAEEYIKVHSSQDGSYLDLAIYPAGHRPSLIARHTA
jgi:hypothetical protein